ncbi:MAG: hypothetical protein WCA85_31820 [Paraburkholderia sp.]|uniref:hypothetical protein n=1 Tax=Paraburkholderia sp. TaxID=1926495 RepID=UPI003C555036
MSTLYLLPNDFSDLVQLYPFDSAARTEIDTMVELGIQRLADVGVDPGRRVYQAAVDDLREFLDEAQRQALAAGKWDISRDDLAAARLRFPHFWPFS